MMGEAWSQTEDAGGAQSPTLPPFNPAGFIGRKLSLWMWVGVPVAPEALSSLPSTHEAFHGSYQVLLIYLQVGN